MKTKIIYISGNEVFEMAQIRAAFEEVRGALGLDKDTILFGVPVDADSALETTITETTADDNVQAITIETMPEPVAEPALVQTTELVSESEAEQITETIDQSPASEPESDIMTEDEDIQEADTESEKIIPILSILSANDDDTEPVTATENAISEPEVVAQTEPENITTDETLAVSIDDVVTDQAPVAEREKTLEELLESMTPLGEDEIADTPDIAPDTATDVEVPETDFSISMTDDVADTDATLAQLANEFAMAQDKIPEPQKPAGNGKIGKLKNILPFKKAKRDDNSLMGDLFGWAGIAANDEDFSIPGFFTGAVGQK